MKSLLFKYTFCVKYAPSYTASKFQAFAVVPAADLPDVSLTHACVLYHVPNLTCLPQAVIFLLPSNRKQLSFLHGRRVFIWHKAQPQVSSNPGRKVAVASKFCTVAPVICGSSIRNLLHVTLVAPRILRWLLDFWKVFASLPYHNKRYVLFVALTSFEDSGLIAGIMTAFLSVRQSDIVFLEWLPLA